MCFSYCEEKVLTNIIHTTEYKTRRPLYNGPKNIVTTTEETIRSFFSNTWEVVENSTFWETMPVLQKKIFLSYFSHFTD